MEPTLDESLRKAFERARKRLLENMPLLAQTSESSLGARAMSAAEVGVLKSVGLSVTPWKEGAEKDPLMQSISDYMALLATSYTTREAGKLLKVDPSRIRQRLRERSLYGTDYDGQKRLPRFQFEQGRVIPGLRDVLAVVPEDLNALDVAVWFLSPNPDLEVKDKELSPRGWLLSGQSVEAAIDLARRLGDK